MTDPTIPSNAFEVLLHATGRRLTGKQYINEHGQTVKEFRDMNTTNPPLPDYLDVPAAEIGSEHEHEWQKGAAYKIAAETMVGACGYYCDEWVTLDPTIAPHDCIARWAGDDAKRWDRIDIGVLAIGLENTSIESMDLGTLDDDGVTSVVSAYAFCKATPSQLYRALVNVGWDDWRAQYNKRREAEEVRDEAE